MLEDHRDGCEFSFVLGLNKMEDYAQGGTMFTVDGSRALQGEGDLLLFSGQNEHRGVEISKGKRYILTGFVSLHEQNYCGKEIGKKFEDLESNPEETLRK